MSADQLRVISEVMEVGNVDTVYRDLYLRRAGSLMGGVLSLEEFRRIEAEQAQLAALPVAVARALQSADWERVKALSSRSEAIRREMDAKRRHLELARDVYAVGDVRLDPFSPGLLPFTRIGGKELAALQARTAERLGGLARSDAPWKDFYASRRAALLRRSVVASEDGAVGAAGQDPLEAAQQALKTGNMRELARLAETMLAQPAPGKEAAPSRRGPVASDAGPADLLTTYADDTVKAARRFGLAPRRLEARPEIAALRQYLWNPILSEESGGQVKVKQVPLPEGVPDAFRDRLEMLMIHPLVNSGGARHVPKLIAEDVLVEDFPDPKEGDEPPPSEVLARLGFAGRRGLARIAIEQALLARGADLLERDLRLDPRVFRLVCIPPDVHFALGERERWGRQPYWTHFDGYLVMANGRLRALAGGDVRYGGLNDLLGIGLDYDSDRVMARFAVVRRERMVP
jgi:hypothetical protein